MRFLLIISFLIISFASCKKAQVPSFEQVTNFKVISPGLSKTVVSADVSLRNPNSFSFQLKEANCDLYIDGQLIGHFKNKEGGKIPAYSIFTIPVKGEVNTMALAQIALLAHSASKYWVEIKGKAEVGKSAIRKNFPIQYADSLSWEKLNIKW